MTSLLRSRRILRANQLALLRRDARDTIEFYRRFGVRRKAMHDLRGRTSPEELFRFTQAHFVRPAAQNESELVRFIDAVRAIRPQTACEIGVQDGGTNFILSRALSTLDTMIGIDLHISLKCQLRYFRRPDLRLSLIEGSSQAPRTVRRLADALDGRLLDVLFIDGDHSLAGSIADFLLYRRLFGLAASSRFMTSFQTRIRATAYARPAMPGTFRAFGRRSLRATARGSSSTTLVRTELALACCSTIHSSGRSAIYQRFAASRHACPDPEADVESILRRGSELCRCAES